MDRSGTALHYLDVGEGMPVVLLHGNPTWSFLYRDVIRALQGECRCIAPDYPGFGFSGHPAGYSYTPGEHAQWVGELVDRLDLERFVLVGHDWGGPVGLSLATARPERVAGLVLCNTWCWPPFWNARVFSAVVGGPLGVYLHRRHNFFARVILPWGIHSREARAPEVLAAYRAPFPDPPSRRGTWVFPREIRTAAPWLRGVERQLGHFTDRPVEMVWGMRDPAFSGAAYLRKWRRIFPQAGLDRVEDASHYLPEDRPDRLAAGIRRVLSAV